MLNYNRNSSGTLSPTSSEFSSYTGRETARKMDDRDVVEGWISWNLITLSGNFVPSPWRMHIYEAGFLSRTEKIFTWPFTVM